MDAHLLTQAGGGFSESLGNKVILVKTTGKLWSMSVSHGLTLLLPRSRCDRALGVTCAAPGKRGLVHFLGSSRGWLRSSGSLALRTGAAPAQRVDGRGASR